MGGVVGDKVGIAKAVFGVRDGFDLVGWLVCQEVGVPFVVEGCTGLGGPFGVCIGAEGGDGSYLRFLN